MDVYYEKQKLKSTSLQRQAEKIGAIPSSSITRNFNYVTTWTTTANSWNYLLLNGLTQGTSGSQRIGRQILMTHMQWYYAQNQLSRLALVYDTQTNGSAPTAADIFQDSADQFSPYNFSNLERFCILYDSLYDTTPELLPINRYMDFPINKYTSYNVGNAGTVADIATGSLYLVGFTTSVLSVTLSCNLYYEE